MSAPAASATGEPVLDPGTVTLPQEQTKTRLAPRYKVFLHNDPVTPMLFVVQVLATYFAKHHKDALKIMLEAHTKGIAFVGAYSFEQAEFKVDQAHSLARAQGYPLTFTYEAE